MSISKIDRSFIQRAFQPKRNMHARNGVIGAVALACAVLSGCGGGGSSAPEVFAPTIVAQPTSQIAQAGSNVTFSVAIDGVGLLIRWQLSTDAGLNWADIANAIAAQYTVVAPTATMNGYRYRAIITNSAGTSVTSDPVTLTVATASHSAGDVFRDCTDVCSELVVLPRGSYQMGVRPATDVFRELASPLHTVTIGYDLAVGRSEVTRAEFSRFVQVTSYKTDAETGAGCYATNGLGVSFRTDRNWRTPGFSQTDTDPAVCISWNDAKAYVAWLNTASPVTTYRLLTESEWEYAARAGQGASRYSWGDDLAYQQVCAYANSVDRTATGTVPRLAGLIWADCVDGYAYTAPADALSANGFGLRNMIGNAWEWVEDGWHASYAGAPADGSAWVASAGELSHVYRGGSWNNHPTYLDPSYRARNAPSYSDEATGFRIARRL